MRSFTLLLFVILASGIGAARWETDAPPRDPARVEWVRTVDGWARSDTLFPVERRAPGLHPFVVASFQALGSALALVAARRPPAGS